MLLTFKQNFVENVLRDIGSLFALRLCEPLLDVTRPLVVEVRYIARRLFLRRSVGVNDSLELFTAPLAHLERLAGVEL